MLEFGRPLIWGENTVDTAQTFALPAGTVTFLPSDIDGSTRLWEAEPDAMARAVPRLYRIFDEAVSGHGGRAREARCRACCRRFMAALHSQRSVLMDIALNE